MSQERKMEDALTAMGRLYADAIRGQFERESPFIRSLLDAPVVPPSVTHDLTVAEVAAALAALPAEVQDYELWIEADPSMPVGSVPSWIDHEGRRVFL